MKHSFCFSLSHLLIEVFFQAILDSYLEGKMFLILSRIPLTNTNTLLRLAAYLEVNLSGSLM